MQTIYRSFPQLRELRRADKSLSQEQVNKLIADLYAALSAFAGDAPDWQKRLGAAAIVLAVYPEAKKYLIDHGRAEDDVNALPAPQVVVIYFLEDYDRAVDEVLKWSSVPAWQARAGLDQALKDVRPSGGITSNPIIGLTVPAVVKMFEARARQERQVAALRCAEALRQYAADHGGNPAPRLDAVKLPLPTDPYTGEGFGKYYKVEADGTGVLDVPPPPNMPPSLGRRFEATPPK